MKTRYTLRLLAFLLLQHSLCLCVQAQGTAITYQGRLTDGPSAASGSYDFRFTAYNAGTAGSPVGTVVTTNGVAISNGVFTATLNFGAGVFTGPSRWLQIEVKTNGAPSYTTLTPRQPLTPSPYAIYTPNAGAAATATTAASASSVTAGSITSASLAPGSVTAAAIAPGAVSSLGASDGSPTNALVVNTNGLVGIGTNAPGAVLEISGGANIISPQVLFERRDESGGYSNLFGAGSVACAGNLMAVAAGYDQDGFTIIDISTPNSPVLHSQFRDGEGTFGNIGIHQGQTAALAMKTNLLVIAGANDHAVTLISLTNPSSPVKLSELRDGIGGWNELANPYAVSISGNLLAIVGYGDDAVTLADISNPAAPIKRVEIKDGQFGYTNMAGVQAVALSGNLLAIGAYDDNTVTLVNVSNPASPVKLAELQDDVNGFTGLAGVTAVALSGNLLAIASFDGDGCLTLVNVANPSNPIKLAEWRDGEAGMNFLNRVHSVAFSSNWLAASAWDDRAVTLFDITDPANPRLAMVLRDGIAGFNSLLMPGGITFAGDNLAITSFEDRAVTFASFPSVAAAGLVSQQRIGIGLAQPAAPLHVAGNVIVQDAALFDINANRVEFGDATATGNRSVAAGSPRTLASGDNSIAMGDWAIASGPSAVALGNGAIASGQCSVALGNGSIASGYSSTALGVDTIASGHGATALGYRTVADGYASLAAGKLAQANHEGTFVWSDSKVWDDFVSTADHQFLIRANGGVGINKNNPATALDVNGTVTVGGNLLMGSCTNTGVASVALGTNTTASATAATVGGGMRNTASGAGSTVAGGGYDGSSANGNTASGAGSTIGGGTQNIASGSRSTVGGGHNNTVTNYYATVPGGAWNLAGGQGSFAAGRAAKATHSGAFVWNDNTSGDLVSTTDNSVSMRAAGGYRLFSGNTSGVSLAPGGGSWTSMSDRNAKEEFQPVNSRDVLDKVTALPITTWKYKSQGASIRHLGPMAQDFKAAFGLGESDTGITTIDASGVAFAAIQGLNAKVDGGIDTIRELQAENTELKQRLDRLEQLLIMKNEGNQ